MKSPSESSYKSTNSFLKEESASEEVVPAEEESFDSDASYNDEFDKFKVAFLRYVESKEVYSKAYAELAKRMDRLPGKVRMHIDAFYAR